jgi:hypothetical protein
MPIVAIVDGVTIRLHYADHEPAHFHAVLGDEEMLVRIVDLSVMAGDLPPARRRAILDWAHGRREALALAWLRCRQGEKPGRLD